MLYILRAMNVDAFIADIGGRAEVMSETGLSKGRISQWCVSGWIPLPWRKYFVAKYPEQCARHGISDDVHLARGAA